MADFNPAFERMLMNEGGFKLTNIAGDRGGQTYAGIARNPNPQWQGWSYIDRGEIPPTALVRAFYKTEFWDKVQGDSIVSQEVASNIFDFAVNAGVRTSVKLAQLCVQVSADGALGPKSLEALNACNPEVFVLRFALAKITRYRDIVTKDRTQIKFLLGWINRTLKEAA